MKLIITLILCCVMVSTYAQKTEEELKKNLKTLTPEEEVLLKSLPIKKIPTGYTSRSLPSVVDNSQLIYMRSAYNQAHYSCGQASLIGYNFTYEMARERNVSASDPDNQYPTHFAWNFMNGGNGYYGVSYLHSAQMLISCGSPNVTDYGGMAYGGFTRWMSGFQNYRNAMDNRISTISQIPVGTAEELQTLKYWLYDHLEGSESGGLASFYAGYVTVYETLPAGTPEEGKYVLTGFGSSPNHAMTIVGFHDNVRWDYNNDGQYTNDIDINNDGVVNMKDWEIGGFKMVQSYGGVPNWGDQGYCYMMYKTVADEMAQGGVWNHCVHVMDVKEEFEPELVAKVTLKHDRRVAVKLIAGFSNNVNATSPEYILDSPIFDYQGGDNYMQGGDTEADKTIEFGLDLSPFITNIDLGQHTRFFLQVVENDPWHLGDGEIVSFSIIDYTNGGTETISPQSHVTIIDNDTTTASLTYASNYNRVEIETESLPEAIENQSYSYQLTASGGATPYFWEFDKTYEETNGSESFNAIDETQLYPSNNSSGMVSRQLEFDFPFYDSTYSSITVHVDGYLMFDEQLYPYPYFNDDNVLFKVSRSISPFMTQYQRIYTGSGGGIWYEGDENSATFRWKTKIDGDTGSDLNYSATLYPNGDIKFNYGVMMGFGDLLWLGGVSDGDNFNFTRSSNSNQRIISEGSKTELEKYDYLDEMLITSDGLFYGTPGQPYPGSVIKFKVTDNTFISSTKNLTFSTSSVALLINDSISSGGDETVECGETAFLSFELINDGGVNITNASLTISSNNEYITILDDSEFIGNIGTGESLPFINCVSFDVHPNIPHGRLIRIDVLVESDLESWETTFSYLAHAPDIEIEEVYVDDDDGLLDPGETSDIAIAFVNDGGVSIEEATAVLSTENSLITINNNTGVMYDMEPADMDTLIFNVTVASTVLNGESVEFQVLFTGSNDYESSDNFELIIGRYQEDFETGDLSFINWGYDGDEAWQVDNFLRYEGQYSARSGFIIDNQSSSLVADISVVLNGTISFYKKVSCELGDDYLSFYIDEIEQESWTGENDWSFHEYPIEQGFHRLEWKYQKNESVAGNMDGVWLDLISFPSFEESPPSLSFDSSSVTVDMAFDQTDIILLPMNNSGAESINFKAYISLNEGTFYNSGRNVHGSYIFYDQKTIHSGGKYQIELVLYNASLDNEWLKDLTIQFPEGVMLEDASNFTGGTGELIFEGDLGNGITATWHGEDDPSHT